MVNEKDIVIGNWFIDYNDKPFKWALAHWHLVGRESGCEIDEIIKGPILLTPEVLDKCSGCSRLLQSDCYGVQQNGLCIYIDYRGDVTVSMEVLDGDYISYLVDLKKKVTTLHEWQNLVYYLTGYEIEYKP